MCESQPCWVTSTSGPNARTSGGTTAWKARSQPASPVPGGSAPVTAGPAAAGPPGSPVPGGKPPVARRADRVRPAGLGRKTGPREQHLTGLVERDREHPRIVVKDLLHAVTAGHGDADARAL